MVDTVSRDGIDVNGDSGGGPVEAVRYPLSSDARGGVIVGAATCSEVSVSMGSPRNIVIKMHRLCQISQRYKRQIQGASVLIFNRGEPLVAIEHEDLWVDTGLFRDNGPIGHRRRRDRPWGRRLMKTMPWMWKTA